MIKERFLSREMKDLHILSIDTSGKIASAAICTEENIIASYTIQTEHTHSQVMLPLCKKMIEDADFNLENVDIFAVANGPGSYTGLRIGISIIKAMAFALDKKCVGVSTLEGLAYNLIGHNTYVCPIIKARQELVYTALFQCVDGKINQIEDDAIISIEDLYEKLIKINDTIIFNGDGIDLFFERYNKNNFVKAPVNLRFQSAVGIAMAAFNKKADSPHDLNAEYLQLTKAEKDINK